MAAEAGAGLAAGAAYGLLRMAEPGLDAVSLPWWFTEKFAAFLWSMGITASVMLLVSVLWGWEKTGRKADAAMATGTPEGELPEVREFPNEKWTLLPWHLRPEVWAVVLLSGVIAWIGFAFW